MTEWETCEKCKVHECSLDDGPYCPCLAIRSEAEAKLAEKQQAFERGADSVCMTCDAKTSKEMAELEVKLATATERELTYMDIEKFDNEKIEQDRKCIVALEAEKNQLIEDCENMWPFYYTYGSGFKGMVKFRSKHMKQERKKVCKGGEHCIYEVSDCLRCELYDWED